ncbi:MAG: glycosyltransferase [Bacteroidales bacterium]|nr:glycosyltransferase [Bacteroidales bacterium]
MKITTIITTKNRVSLFERALKSVLNQIRQPDEIIVVSDSAEDNFLKEKDIVNDYATIIKDRYTHNYPGSLNTAIHFKLGNDLFHYVDYQNEYIAFLDDDDIWYPEYLLKCEIACQNKDFVISGIRYISEKGEIFLSIPQEVKVDDFLKGNPHIQGSNTFIRLSILLQAGLFDEMLPSTTDRDLFSRVLMLNPTYSVINEYLLDIDYSSTIDHLTFNYPIKQEGLRHFFFKYQGMMSNDIIDKFLDRTRRLYRCGIEELGKLKIENSHKFRPTFSPNKYSGHLIIGFIATNHDLGIRLIKQLVGLKRSDTQIIIFINFQGSHDDYDEVLSESNYSYQILRKENLDDYHYRELIDFNQLNSKDTLGISQSRSILQKAMYLSSKKESVFWILDDDMELYELHLDTHLSNLAIDIDRIIETYKDDYDAVVGNYSLDTPLPLFATLRSSLLDYMYSQKSPVREEHLRIDDYYHDLSDDDNLYLETPYPLINEEIELDDVFCGKATSRYLSLYDGTIKPVKNRGGNTLVFNRELLQIPNWTISIGGRQGRRSDFFWALLAEKKGYRLSNVPFATLHNREKTSFNYENEEKKFLSDLIGSSFTKAVDEIGIDATSKIFHISYVTHFKQRLVKYIANYYRIIGLLSIIGSKAKTYQEEFSFSRLHAFVKNCEYYLDFHRTKAAIEVLRKRLDIYSHYLGRDVFENIIQTRFETSNLKYLGTGKEGIVFCDANQVYKYFFRRPENLDFMKTISKVFSQCKYLYPIEIIEVENTCIIKYPFEASQKYSEGYADQIAELIRFSKVNGFVIRNFTNNNFVIVNETIKFIDYGHSFEPFDDALYKQSIQRAYQVIRYPFLDEIQFKELVALSYSKKTSEIDSGISLFQTMVEPRTKEILHDEMIVQMVMKHYPERILDFGSGKCKISNSLIGKTQVSVYDIDQSTLHERADRNLIMIENTTNILDNYYDLILCNLVLCSVDNEENLKILDQISKAIKPNGVVIFSICNPFFADIELSEIRALEKSNQYGCACIYDKMIRSSKNKRVEYHRPIEYYTNLFQRFGFNINAIHETSGVDYSTILPISEHLIFECQMKQKNSYLNKTSLLIKSNPMEHQAIYESIRHIVNQLEKGIRFVERIAVLDSFIPTTRNRRYDQDDLEKTLEEIIRAKKNGLIDRIIIPQHDELKGVYQKYFGHSCEEKYSENGQAIYSTLVGFESVITDYVFQTDSDILYYNDTFGDELHKALHYLDDGAITVSPSIAKEESNDPLFGHRTEVRTSLLNLKKLHDILPIPNEVHDKQFILPWHRSLDKVLNIDQSVRMVSSNFYFIHPENSKKSIPNLVKCVRDSIEIKPAKTLQINDVNLQGMRDQWVSQSDAPMVLYIRGYNTPCSKIKRLLDSIRIQDFTNLMIVYIDDASTNQSGEYVKFVLNHDPFFKQKSIYVGNDVRQKILPNLVFAMQNIITNRNSIVIHIDNDDYLLTNKVLSRIMQEYKNDVELTVGNCVRYNKPLKHYKVYSFEKVWERGGDNVWLHPKTHLRSLFDFVNIDEDLKKDGVFIDVNTDFAFMLPMVEHSKKSLFIPELLYYFEPSHDNISQEKQYKKAYKDEIKAYILKKARDRYEKNNSSHR